MTNDLLKKGAKLEQKVIIVADDLTGANDTGVQFVKAGFTASVLFQPSFEGIDRYKEDVLIVDTDSRSMSSENAYHEVSQMVQPFLQDESHLFLKKIDSTLRGNIGIELQALMDIGPFDAAVIAPAYPDAQRATNNGIHYVEGVPVHLSEAAKDPKTPVLTSSISGLIEEQTNVRPKNLSQQTIGEELKGMNDEVSSLLKHGHQWFVCDAETSDDLGRIVEVFMKMDKRILWVGSAGLAGALSAYIAKHRNTSRLKKQRPVLIVSGSASQKTNEQFAYLRETHDCFEIKVNPLNVLNGREAWERKSVLDQLRKRQNEDILLYTDARPEMVEKMLVYGEKKGLSRQEVGSALSVFLGMITKDIVTLSGMRRLFLTGGDTARAICQELGAGGIRLLKEIEPGIPLGQLVDTNLYAVTKAGAYGQKNSVLHAVEVLKKIEGEVECQNQSLL
ncbi:four-carbon acid sugar kinase family protein [Bacillus sp. FSL R5-0654]|uniref:four-carbon acid sugar kinase family protein n=1 Tax=Bacillus TaxID=1386 RepID=UPI000F0539DF|nr:four-carbon acid sugar kinase family protein [Bacillus safensis]TFV12296.1 type iii effector hrp-dependent outer protein [Bacillus stratosphericus]KAB3541955.1 four-carbon acid sugar kinase family protein [Bacillus safensis]KAB3546013.1 four-carbon acid sugar kinase family protein [Bacillus safensis]MED4594567.1 four-carbon acid sugar kinase family protein [Bacillus safensis]MED4636699.1 four-carbon acid sugar kinase family protein [Bacillus safensis]